MDVEPLIKEQTGRCNNNRSFTVAAAILIIIKAAINSNIQLVAFQIGH